ncbi:hypothetical protein [Rhizobium setariae]|nr:hypothetical protein [Rhizobium setariae]
MTAILDEKSDDMSMMMAQSIEINWGEGRHVQSLVAKNRSISLRL